MRTKPYPFTFTIQRDHDAAFMWNGVNYLLKMPSDLDYLGDYIAIKRWVGFPLSRNPFCVPYPMEEGQALLTGNNCAYASSLKESDDDCSYHNDSTVDAFNEMCNFQCLIPFLSVFLPDFPLQRRP
jgi:hypothetical protein